MKNVIWGLCIALLCSCSDQIKQDRTFAGTALRASNGEPRENIRLSVFQNNGKDFPNNAIETESQITDENGSFSLTINPFNNEEASDIRILAQAALTAQFSGGSTEFFYTIGEMGYTKAEVLDQDEGEPLTADLLTEDIGILALGFTLAGGEVPRGWQSSLRVFNDAFSHELNLNDNDFQSIFRFPVQANEEFTIQMTGTKGGESIDVLETFTVNVPSGVDTEVTFKVTLYT